MAGVVQRYPTNLKSMLQLIKEHKICSQKKFETPLKRLNYLDINDS